jgi:hypothetical protein
MKLSDAVPGSVTPDGRAGRWMVAAMFFRDAKNAPITMTRITAADPTNETAAGARLADIGDAALGAMTMTR